MAVVGYLLTVIILGAVFLTGVTAKVNIAITPANLTFTPDEADRHGKGRVNVTCKYISDGSDNTLEQLSISRILPGTRQKIALAQAAKDFNNGSAVLLSDVPGATVSGSMQEKGIALTLGQATCEDGGQYICEAHRRRLLYFDGGTLELEQAEQNLTFRVKPGQLMMTISPRRKTPWTEGEVLNMTCDGPLGTVDSEQQVTWVWTYTKKYAPKFYLYDGSPSDVTSDVTTVGKHKHCQYQRGRSTLTRRLTRVDSQHVYKCYVRIGGVAYDRFADQYPVGIVVATAGPPKKTVSTFRLYLWGGLGVVVLMSLLTVGFGFGLCRMHCPPSSKGMGRTPRSPLLPLHRDPGWYTYGQYVEPLDHIPQEEGEERSPVYTEIPNHYEDVETDIDGDHRPYPDTKLKQEEVKVQADFTSRR